MSSVFLERTSSRNQYRKFAINLSLRFSSVIVYLLRGLCFKSWSSDKKKHQTNNNSSNCEHVRNEGSLMIHLNSWAYNFFDYLIFYQYLVVVNEYALLLLPTSSIPSTFMTYSSNLFCPSNWLFRGVEFQSGWKSFCKLQLNGKNYTSRYTSFWRMLQLKNKIKNENFV